LYILTKNCTLDICDYCQTILLPCVVITFV